jgi:hypothetical protein
MRAFILVVALLLAVVVAVNGVAAELQARRDAALRKAASAVRPGFAVTDYKDVDERRFQQARLHAIPRPRIVAFGSSRIMQLTTAAVGAAPGEFYNTGMSGATVEDYIAMWAVLERLDKAPEVALFAIDPWIFNSSHPQLRWRVLAEEVDRYLRRSGSSGSPVLEPLERVVYRWYQAKEFLSYAVLRNSVRDLRRGLRSRMAGSGRGAGVEDWLVVSETAASGHQILRADGSLLYDAQFLAWSPEERRETAVRYAANLTAGLAEFKWDTERMNRLVGLWTDMRRRGVTVIAFVPPYHPVAWRTLRDDPRYAQTAGAGPRFLAQTAAGLGVVFGDLSDPDSIPCPAAEFYDGDHATDACLGRIARRLGVVAGG